MKITTDLNREMSLALIKNDQVDTLRLIIANTTPFSNTIEHEVSRLIYSEALLSGTKTLSREDIQKKLKVLGSSIEVSTSNGRVQVMVKCQRIKAPATVRFLFLLFDEANFKNTEQKRIMRTLKNKIDSEKENTLLLANVNFVNLLAKYGNKHRLYLPEDFENALKKLVLRSTRLVHQDFLGTHWSVTISGHSETVKHTVRMVRQYKQTKNNIYSENLPDLFIKNNKRTLVTVEVPSKKNIEVVLGNTLPLTYENKELPAFIFGLAVLGKVGGFAGRLMSTVREKEGLTYGIYARIEKISLNQNGYWKVSTFFSPADIEKGIDSTLREINQIAQKGITNAELTNFRQILKTEDILTYDSPSRLTSQIHGLISFGLTWKSHQDFRQKLCEVTKKDVNQALKKYLNISNLVISLAGPLSSVRRRLIKLK